MKLNIGLVSTVLVLSMVHNVKSQIEFTCLPGDVVNVVVNVTSYPDLRDRFVTVTNTSQCTNLNINQLQDDMSDPDLQTTTVDCFNFTLGVQFTVGFLVNETVILSYDDIDTYDLTCILPENVTVSFDNVTVTGNPIVDIVEGEYQPEVITTVDRYVVAIQEIIPFKFVLEAATRFDVFIALEELSYEIAGTNNPFQLVRNGCPRNTPVGVTIRGTPDDAPAKSLEVDIPAFGVNNAGTFTAFVVNLEFVLIFCPVADPSECYTNDSCPDGTDQIGRKKRQNLGDNIIEERKRESVIVFPSQEAKQAYVDQLLEEAGLSMQPTVPKKGETCVNKTVTGVLLALLLIVMALCLISSVIMVVSMRKNRTDNLVKSDHSYSNKGY